MKKVFEVKMEIWSIKSKGRGFPGGAMIKNPPANVGDTGSTPDLGRSHMPQNQKTKNMKNRSSIVADSIKTLQMAHIIKKSLKKDLVGYLFYIQ